MFEISLRPLISRPANPRMSWTSSRAEIRRGTLFSRSALYQAHALPAADRNQTRVDRWLTSNIFVSRTDQICRVKVIRRVHGLSMLEEELPEGCIPLKI